MKSIILLIAIALVLESLFLLLIAAQNGLMYRRTADAKAEYYDRLRRNVVIFVTLGVMTALLAAAAFFIRSRL